MAQHRLAGVGVEVEVVRGAGHGCGVGAGVGAHGVRVEAGLQRGARVVIIVPEAEEAVAVPGPGAVQLVGSVVPAVAPPRQPTVRELQAAVPGLRDEARHAEPLDLPPLEVVQLLVAGHLRLHRVVEGEDGSVAVLCSPGRMREADGLPDVGDLPGDGLEQDDGVLLSCILISAASTSYMGSRYCLSATPGKSRVGSSFISSYPPEYPSTPV